MLPEKDVVGRVNIAIEITDDEVKDMQVAAAMQWIEDYAVEYGYSYDEFMQTAWTHVDTETGERRYGDYITGGAEMEGEYTSEEFWKNFEIVTGQKVERYANFFSCSC